MLGGAIDASSLVGLTTSNGTEVDDVPGISLLEIYTSHVLRKEDFGDIVKGKSARLTRSCVMEIRPSTLVANIASISASAIEPTLSTPCTNPALFTATQRHLSIEYYEGDNADGGDTPRISMLRRSCGILSNSEATCALSATSNWMVAIFPPWVAPDSLCAAAAASATVFKASVRRARRIKLEPAYTTSLYFAG